jgi:hypothetical protein
VEAFRLGPHGEAGKPGLKRSVLFSPTFVAYGDEPLIEAEHEASAIAVAMAAVKARP